LIFGLDLLTLSHLIGELHERISIIVTANLEFSEWPRSSSRMRADSDQRLYR
jgi:hypothetical protein